MITEIGADALFNEAGTHRYYLYRRWDLTKPMVMFIGLNPSKADAEKNDNTITKVIKVSKNNGYGGLYMMNLFSVISTDPKYLLTCSDPLLDNDKWLDYIHTFCKDIVFCWGAFKQAKNRATEVIIKFQTALCFEILKGGQPKHPLFCKDKSILIPFNTKP